MAEAHKQVVKVEKYNGITTVWMNRPEKKNAMNPALHEAMDRALAELETDPDTKVVVIRGSGGNFSPARPPCKAAFPWPSAIPKTAPR